MLKSALVMELVDMSVLSSDAKSVWVRVPPGVLFFLLPRIPYTCVKEKWEYSSVGSEHYPYKVGVIGSNPIIPTIFFVF